MRESYKHLVSIPFLGALFTLLLNDFFLKPSLHNFLTGKISDFCGLFVFSIFWTALFPNRKNIIFFLTAILFVLWKSPYSTPFIEVFSRHLFPIGRVIDLSDLAALLVLPLAYKQLSKPQEKVFSHPYLIGTITIFSFCATSSQRNHQSFDLPQYVLLQTPHHIPDSLFQDNEYGISVYQNDSLVAISVSELIIKQKPVRYDDFQKQLLLQDLDNQVINIIYSYGYQQKLSKAQSAHRLLVSTRDGFLDSLNFSGSRLNGLFFRYDSLGKLLIRGQYRNGIEDSTWIFTSPEGNITQKKQFVGGELVRTESYENGSRISSKEETTRADAMRNKYFHLAILLTFAIGLSVLIVKNWRNSEEKVKYRNVEKFVYPFLLPIGVIIAIRGISIFIPDVYEVDFQIILDVFFAFIVSAPLFIIVFTLIKMGKRIDLLWYTLLFALLISLAYESIQLKNFYDDAAKLKTETKDDLQQL